MPARRMARRFACGRARAKHLRFEIKRELPKIGPRFPPREEGPVRTLQERRAILVPIAISLLFLFLFLFSLFRVFALLAPKDEPRYTWKSRRLWKAAPARAPLCSGLKNVPFGRGKADPKPAAEINQPGYSTQGKNSSVGDRQRAGLPLRERVSLPAGPGSASEITRCLKRNFPRALGRAAGAGSRARSCGRRTKFAIPFPPCSPLPSSIPRKNKKTKPNQTHH